jgi:hypothetical protein
MKSIIHVICFLFAFTVTVAQTPNTWTRMADFGGSHRGGSIFFSTDSFGYIGLGEFQLDTFPYRNVYPTDLWMYTPDSISTGINSIDAIDISISPNPTNDRLYINGLTQDATVVIADMTGRLVNVPISEKKIDVSSLPQGMYCLHAQCSSGSMVKKFVKE